MGGNRQKESTKPEMAVHISAKEKRPNRVALHGGLSFHLWICRLGIIFCFKRGVLILYGCEKKLTFFFLMLLFGYLGNYWILGWLRIPLFCCRWCLLDDDR